MAPPADVLMVSQPTPSGWHLMFGITGVGAAAALGDAAARIRGFGASIACGPDNSGFALAAAWLEDAVEPVVNGPVSSEQPRLQPVAAGPTNVGENGP